MMKYKIIPRDDVMLLVDADNADDAMIWFSWSMDSDMNQYFQAVPATEDDVYEAAL